ncbi:MAG: hypothetical protein ACE5FT_03170 [Candidatus Nanoarchaeia archaeon]
MLFQYYGGYGRFGNVGYYLQYWGIFDVILPFMLVFAIVYAALNQLKIFTTKYGKEGDKAEKVNKNINITIAFVIALMFIGPHMTGGTANFYTRTIGMDPVVVINQAIPHVGVIAVAATLALIMAGLFGFSGAGNESSGLRAGALALSVLAIIAVFMYSLGWFQTWLWFLSDPGLQMAILALLVFGGLVMFMIGGKAEE